MVRRTYGSIAALTLFLTASAHAEVEPGDLTLSVTPELNANTPPFSREMVLLRIRGVYRQQILLEELLQPSLANFSWTQLGRDRWTKTKLPNGQTALALDRVIAIFPHHAGAFTIEPFVHRLTINDDGSRRVVDVRSPPISMPVATWDSQTGGPDVTEPWWLPAKRVTISDLWQPDPELLTVGETARRTVTIEAEGLVAEGLPPRPIMRTRGILTFAGPVTRETIITPTGPVARITYQWDIRPAIDEIISLDSIAIPWFDTTSRTIKEADIPARQIGGGFAELNQQPSSSEASPIFLATAALATLLVSFVLIQPRPSKTKYKIKRSSLQLLYKFAKNNDLLNFHGVLQSVRQNQPDLWKALQRNPEISEQTKKINSATYARPSYRKLNLLTLARQISTKKIYISSGGTRQTSLMALDGSTESQTIR